MVIHGARTGGRRASKGSLGSQDARCIKMIENISTITMVSARASEVITSSSESEGNKNWCLWSGIYEERLWCAGLDSHLGSWARARQIFLL